MIIPKWVDTFLIPDRDYVVDLSDLSRPASTNPRGETIEETLKKAHKMKSKNIDFYTKCYEKTKMQQFQSNAFGWQQKRFVIMSYAEYKKTLIKYFTEQGATK